MSSCYRAVARQIFRHLRDHPAAEILRREPLRDGSLVEVDVAEAAESAGLFIACPRDRGASAKIRSLADHFMKRFGAPPYCDCQQARVPPPAQGTAR